MDDMATLVDKQHKPPAPERQRRPRPWSPRAWRQALYLAAGIPAQLLVAVPFAICVRAIVGPAYSSNHPLSVLLALLVTLGALLFGLPLLLLLPVLTRMQRHRLRVTAGVAIPPHPPGATAGDPRARSPRPPARRPCGGRPATTSSPRPALAVAAIVAIGTWLGSLVYLFVYAYGWGLSAGSMLHRGLYRGPRRHPPAAHCSACRSMPG